jgi:nicotinate-nucleotide pyrophosphorylase (carboxylating)
MDLKEFITASLSEDVGSGDHTSLSTIPTNKTGKARLLVKEHGIIAGLDVALAIFNEVDSTLKIDLKSKDGTVVAPGDELFYVEGSVQSILKAERLVLNCMQRMSGIATTTNMYVKAIEGTNAKILDTRKTTPLLRSLEKQAVKIGGGHNHRFGLYDMILIKDNHVDSAGGITQALESAKKYIDEKGIHIPIEIETRSFEEIKEALIGGIADRIMFDNFSPEQVKEAVGIVNKKAETEASGGITIANIREYALAGVDFISVGALTHSVKSLDLSLKIIL